MSNLLIWKGERIIKQWVNWWSKGLIAIVFFTVSFVHLSERPAQAASGWSATYYTKQNLTGKAISGGTTPRLNFNWGTHSPRSGVPSNYFSSRYNASVYSTLSYYDFQIHANQGFRLYVDNKLQISHWTKTSTTSFSKILYLSKGYHAVTIQYNKTTGSASLSFNLVKKSVPTLPIASDGWYGEVYPTQNLTGYPELIKKSSNLDFNWGSGSPATGIPTDHFSAIYQRNLTTDTGNYKLQVWADDGVRVYIDNKLVLDQWKIQHVYYFTQTVSLHSGAHKVVVKYFEAIGSAHLKLQLDKVTTSGPPATNPSIAHQSIPLTSTEWNGSLFPSDDFAGTPVAAKTSELNYNWGTKAPAKGIPSDHFTAIFQKQVNFDGNPTDLELWADDGAQVYLDDKLVMDYGQATGTHFYHKILTPAKGLHKIVIKYHEATGSAQLRFDTGTPYRTLDLRKPSNLTKDDIINYFKKYQPLSPLIDDADAFLNAEKTYGVNAVYLVAHAIHETGYGTSKLSIYKNNLFGYGAYDVCPFTCAFYFPNHEASIDQLAYGDIKNYLTPGPSSYYVPEFGPNLIGMNVNYATDQHWFIAIANYMQAIKPYDEAYYDRVNDMSTNPAKPITYGRDVPDRGALPSDLEINFPADTQAVTTGATSLRSIPIASSNYNVASVASGAQVTVLGYNTDVQYTPTVSGNYQDYWYRVRVNGQTGWIYGGALNIQNLLQATSSLRVYTDPDNTSAPLTDLLTPNTTYLTAVLDSKNQPITQSGFFEVQVPNSTETGWVQTDLVKQINQ